MNDNFNLTPERIITTKSSDGSSSISSIYTFETWTNMTLLKLIVLFLISAILLPITSVIFLIAFCMVISFESSWLNVFGILAGVYFILDQSHGWFISTIMKIFYDMNETRVVIILNGSLIVTHIILLFFGPLIYKVSNSNRLISLIFICLITFLSYLVANLIFKYNLIESYGSI
jgi:hypothetical protein